METPSVGYLEFMGQIMTFAKNPITVLDGYVDKYGPFFHIPGQTFRQKAYISIDPDINRHILQKNHRNYEKSFVQTEILARYLGKGLLTIEGAHWLRQRRLIQPGFHREKLLGILDIMHQVMDDLLERVEVFKQDGEEVDIYELMLELSFEMVARSLFGGSMLDEDLKKLRSIIHFLQEFIVKQIRLPFLEFWRKLKGELAKADELAAESRGVVMKYIRSRRNSGERHDDLLDMLLNARYEDTGEVMEDEQVLDEAIILFIAGHETTANALAWIFYLMEQHPDEKEKLLNEWSGLNTQRVAFSELRGLKATSNFINESMRLYPPAWLTDRVAKEDDEINGHKIEAGSLIVTYIYGAHRNERYWKDPLQFKPDRFENAKEIKPYTYFPFGGGPRLCIGNSFAMMEMQVLMSRLFTQYHFEVSPGQDLSPLVQVTMKPMNGIRGVFV